MSYTRVTDIERSQIYVLRQAGKGNNEIARIIGRDKGTVSREVRRNKGLKGYRHPQAHRKAEERAERPGPRFRREVRLDAEEKLRKGGAPEQICGQPLFSQGLALYIALRVS